MNRHLRFLTLILALPVGGSALRAATPASPPNVIFILADDLGWGDLRCYGNPHLDTPALDALAARGVRFTDHYAPAPLCAPARAGFLTGRYPHRTGAVDVPSNRGLDRIDLGEKTFGDWFRHAGYATALIGKWHSGLYCADYLPHRRGFDLFFGFPNGGHDYARWQLQRNDTPAPHDGRYLTDALNDEAIAFIRRSRDRPFALWLAHHAPHAPLHAPEALVKKYRARLGAAASEAAVLTFAMIEAMDTGLARVFAALDAEGLRERTAIVFTSDNGAFLGNDGTHGSMQRFHGPFSGQKGDVAEQGVRVPAIVAWPGVFPAGRVVATPVHGCDWLPTLFALTGRAAPPDAKPLDGADLGALLRGQPAPQLEARALHFQHNRYAPVAHAGAAVRQGRWKLHWPAPPATVRKDLGRDNPSYLRGVVHPHWEMPLDLELDSSPPVSSRAPRLHDLAADPGEQRDLAAANPEVVATLTRAHDAWFAEVRGDWQAARARIVAHDRAYWRDRAAPDPAALFRDFWLWSRAPAGTDPRTADPLKIFPGFWSAGAR